MFLFFPIPVVTRTLLISLITIFTLVGIMVRPWNSSLWRNQFGSRSGGDWRCSIGDKPD